MKPSSLRRFLHLERPRKEAAASAGPPARARFDAVEIAPAPPDGSAPLPASSRDRFRAPEASGLALEVSEDGAQPFVRCACCETDHARGAGRCERCGADLRTPEQRAYNERLWAARRQQAEEEDRAAAVRREALQQDQEESARTRRAMAETLGEEVLARERARLGQGRGWRLLARLGEILGTRLDRSGW